VISIQSLSARQRWAVLIVCYFAAYGFLLPLGNARFWDDWSSHSYNGVRFFSGQIFPFRQLLDELIISNTGGFWLYRPLTFLAFGLSGIAVWGLLGVPRGWLAQDERYWITTFFLLLPYNSVRAIVQGLFSYTFSHVLFFTAWFLLVSRRQWWYFLLSWLCFVLSFPTYSLLFFVLVPAIHCLTCSTFSLRGRLLRFLILGLTSTLYPPLSGEIWPELRLNDGYNEIRSQFLVRALAVFLVINGVSLVMALRQNSQDTYPQRHHHLAPIGLFCFSAGLFPYMAVGHFPNLSDFVSLFVPNLTEMDSRHSLLLPLGTALVMVGAVKTVVQPRHQNNAFFVASAAAILLCVSIYSQYYTDSLKQKGIVDALKNSELVIPTRAVEFRDEATRFNARGRFLYHREYMGLLKEAGRGLDFEIMDKGQYPCDSSNLVEGTYITISSNSGRLRALITGSASIVLSAKPAKLCGPGLTPLDAHRLES